MPCYRVGRGYSQDPRGRQASLTDTAQPIHGHRLEGPPHHGELLQHRVEMVHAERVEAAVGVRPDTGCASAPRQQTDLCPRWEKVLRTTGSSGSSPPTPRSLNTPRIVFLRTGDVTIPHTLSRLKLINGGSFRPGDPAPLNSYPLPCSGPRGRPGAADEVQGQPRKACPWAKGNTAGPEGSRWFGVRDRAEAQVALGSLWWNGPQCPGLTLAWWRGVAWGHIPRELRNSSPWTSSIPVFPPSPKVLGFHCFGVRQGPLAQKL